jgi:hypothetical protein
MDKLEAVAKLTALHKAVSKALEDPQARYFDPAFVLEFFSRWRPICDALRKEYPTLLGDLAVRDTPTSSGTTDFDGRGYIERKFVQHILDDMQCVLDILSALPSVSAPSMRVTKEGLFFSGQYFDALREVGTLVAQAQKTLVLIDAYVNQDTLAILSGKHSAVRVSILTKDVSPQVRIAANAFQKQYGSLEIRASQAFHDRFLIADDVDFYHFGASIKDVGHRGFMFSRIEEREIVDALRAKFAQEWSLAKVVI